MDFDTVQKKNIAAVVIAVCAIVLVSAAVCCSGVLNNSSGPETADTVVYGKIYTSDEGKYAEAFAVKDGKYIYVGDAEGAEDYIKEGTTEVIDYRDKGLIMPGATEGHGHYAAQGILQYLKFYVPGNNEKEVLDNVRTYVETHPDKEFYFTFGWSNVEMTSVKASLDMRTQLDEICSDKIVIAVDDSGHNAFVNSKTLELAGVTVDTEIKGGVIGKIDKEIGGQTVKQLSGLLSDLAYNYVLKKTVANMEIFSENDYAGICEAMEEALLSKGYTYYQDGWTNYFGTQIMDCLETYDKTVGLSVYVSGTYKIDSFDDWKSEVDSAAECKDKYATDHFVYTTLKLFADGEAVESGSGWLKGTYVNGTHGTQVWETGVMNEMVKAANEKGLSVHVHAQGDAAVEQVVNAYIYAEDTAAEGVNNGICHGRNITEETKDAMAEHGIYASININWRTLIAEKDGPEYVKILLPEDIAKAGYPIKSLIDRGIVVTSSTDVPAASGAPTTVSGIIEVAVNDTCSDKEVWKLNVAEEVTVEQAMDIMTINGAKQLQIEDERGSIEVGKYADFLLFDKDFTSCAKDKIHEANVAFVYFEGDKVYTCPSE